MPHHILLQLPHLSCTGSLGLLDMYQDSRASRLHLMLLSGSLR